MKKPRIVPDTNVLISAFIKTGKPREIFHKFLNDKIIFILSSSLLTEFIEVI